MATAVLLRSLCRQDFTSAPVSAFRTGKVAAPVQPLIGSFRIVRFRPSISGDVVAADCGFLPRYLGRTTNKSDWRSNSEVSFSSDTASKMEITNDNVIIEDKCTVKDSVSQSSQIHIMGVLDEIIAEERNNKVTRE
ncbi:uncharacterized protein [Henckelia pumila]|uniref:uncharacterized protein n=1 Tax=Henckelia pumila TaxID=405737 RepID=UPI003C6DF0F0